MVRLISDSLPGMGVAEMTTVSPWWMRISGWSRLAMRTSAEVGSPWLPVVSRMVWLWLYFFRSSTLHNI